MGSEALSYTVFVGFPASALVFYLYAKSIQAYGPRFTLRVSEIACCAQLIFMICIHNSLTSGGVWTQVAVIGFYAYREIYVTLLSTQQWSFIASALTASTSTYIVSFAGIVSMSSALGKSVVNVLL